jgi:hypothetical protein
LHVTRYRDAIGDEADAHEPVGLVVREIAEEHAVDDGADADRRADPDAEGGDDAGGESRRSVQAAEGEARVAGKIVSATTPRASLVSSRKRCVLPKRSRAARRASASPMPRRMFSAVSISR